MSERILLLLAHSIEEHDQLRLLSSLGYDVFSIGSYIDPAHPGDDKRDPLPDVPYHADLHAAVNEAHAHPGAVWDEAKRNIPPAVLDWCDTIICHHYEHQWLIPQWRNIRDKRVIWRTVGQSVEANERAMTPLREDGVQIVRYSPRERHIPGFAGEDAVIRFYADPDEWHGWTGERRVVTNVTQKLKERDPFTGYGFWQAATEGLPVMPMGEGSEDIGGTGILPLAEMRANLRAARCYLYTGTQPASLTLGLIEALMTGIPVVSIGRKAWASVFPDMAEAFEAPDLCPDSANHPADAHAALSALLADYGLAREISQVQRARTIETFGMTTVAAQWREFLG